MEIEVHEHLAAHSLGNTDLGQRLWGPSNIWFYLDPGGSDNTILLVKIAASAFVPQNSTSEYTIQFA